MENIEKVIYNNFLKVSRSENKRPYKYRKKFDDFENHPDYPFVKKLGAFFKKFPHIKIDIFFQAPYRVYDEAEYYDLKFYTTPRAIKLYSIYTDRIDLKNPDSDQQIEFIKESLLFAFKFCRDNKITFDKYMDHTTGDIKTVLLHIRDRNISPYIVYGVKDLKNVLEEYSPEFLDFIAGKDFEERVDLYRSRYYNSRKAKSVIVQGLEKLTKILTN